MAYQYPYWGPLPEEQIGSPVEHPHATTVLILGALSLLCCGAVGPVAWVIGKRALDQIDMSGGQLGGRSQVLVGYIMGIVGTIFMVLGAVLFAFVLIGGH